MQKKLTDVRNDVHRTSARPPSHLVLSPCRVPSTATVGQELVQGMVKDGRNPASKGAPVVHARRTSTLSQNYLTGVLRLH